MISEKTNAVHAEARSFEQMHFRLKGPIEGYVYYLTGTRQDLEDVVQEIYIKLWMNWRRLHTMRDDELKNYVFIAVKNYVTNERRQNSRPKRNKRMFLKEYAEFYTGYYWHDDILIAEGDKIHREAIDQLADMQRLAYLYHINDYSAEEIANRLNRSKLTVHNNISAAYKKVKLFLNHHCDLNLHTGRKNCWKPASLN